MMQSDNAADQQKSASPSLATGDSTESVAAKGSTAQHDGRLHIYVVIITTILVIGGLKAATTVVLPVVFALFLLALFWPLAQQLQQHMPRSLAMVGTFLALLGIIGIFVVAFWYSGSRISADASQYTASLQRYVAQLESMGIQLPGIGSESGSTSGLSGLSSLESVGRRLLNGLFSATSGFVLTIAYLMLALLEVPAYRKKLSTIIPGGQESSWFATIERIAHDFQRYMVIRTGVGLLNGLLAWVGLWLLGVDFAFTWGLLTFLLNYIPTIGSIIATIPPPLFALVQFDSYGMALATLLLVGGLQLVLGVYVDPLIQGRYLSPSPLIVLISVAFWGWLWGGTGAFIAVPLTILVILACRQYERTRWIAILLAGADSRTARDEQHGKGLSNA